MRLGREMLTPPQLVHASHGSPRVDGCDTAEGRCYVCVGECSRGKTIKNWLSSNFTDQNRARCPAATHVCEACCYVMSRTSPVLGRPPKPGKKFGGNFRNYSHLYSDGWPGVPFGESQAVPCYANASKGEKPLIREFLQLEHAGFWFAAIADSGQKHVLTFAPLNYGPGGTVLFEEDLIDLPDSFELVDACTDMLTGGVTKDELLSGDYRVMTMREMTAEVRAFEAEHAHWRGSGWMALAVWLAQRDDEQHAALKAARKEEKKANAGRGKKKKVGNTGGRVRSRAPKRVHKGTEPPPADELLGHVPSPDAERGTADDASERMGDTGAAEAADTGPAQPGLPGIT